MTKVVLTKGQFSWLSYLQINSKWTSEEIIKGYLKGKAVIGMEPVDGLDFNTLIKALSNGYEIEKPRLEIGSWVVITDGNARIGEIHKIVKVCEYERKSFKLSYGNSCYWPKSQIRHATKEETFWAELGREVGEFRDDDVVQTKSMVKPCKLKSKQDLSDAKVEYLERNIKGFYPAESFKPFPTGNE